MQEISFGLGETSFLHRKSGIYLRTRANIQVLCQGDGQAASAEHHDLLQSIHSWFPRARYIRLSLHFSFTDDLDLTTLADNHVTSIIAYHLESADLWQQLGYEASLDLSARYHDRLEFDLCSREHNGSSTLVPDGVCPRILRSVQLHLHFAGSSGSAPEPGMETHMDVISARACTDSTPAGSQSLLTQTRRLSYRPDWSKVSLYPKQKPRTATPLDETVLLALFDAGFRNSLCPRPIRLAAGLKCSYEQDMRRLCDIAPSSFIPNYTQKFEAQANLIPAISRFLTPFLPFSSSHAAKGRIESVQGPAECIMDYDDGESCTAGLEKDLWMTVARGVQSHEQARRLHPIWLSAHVDSSRKSTHLTERKDHRATLQDEDLLCGVSDLVLHRSSQPAHDDEENLLDFMSEGPATPFTRCFPDVTSDALHEWHNDIAVDSCDAGIEGYRAARTTINHSSYEPGTSFDAQGSCRHRCRRNSVSESSDGSMIMILEAPIEEAPIIRQPRVIGGPLSLTQNVIRNHPLRQHGQELYLAEQRKSDGDGHSLYEGDDWGWSDGSLSSDDLLESQMLGPQRPTPQEADSCTSSVYFHEQYPTPELWNGLNTPMVHSRLENMPMSTSTQEDASTTVTSLADVIGNDHLLWHMWKRRGSVASCGEQDIRDIRAMYETDPDMKLFGRGWDMDPSDMSPGSTDGPMLHEIMEDPPPQEKHIQPTTPDSGRRTYFSLLRSPSSPSSPSAVRRSDSDSKFHRRGSILKRLSWGGRERAADVMDFDMTDLDGRTIEVKKRKTLDDYEMRETEAKNDDSSDMLF